VSGGELDVEERITGLSAELAQAQEQIEHLSLELAQTKKRVWTLEELCGIDLDGNVSQASPLSTIHQTSAGATVAVRRAAVLAELLTRNGTRELTKRQCMGLLGNISRSSALQAMQKADELYDNIELINVPAGKLKKTILRRI
jgi:hypothetical protein